MTHRLGEALQLHFTFHSCAPGERTSTSVKKMARRQSVPSRTRQAIAGVLIAVFLSIGLFLKVVRDFVGDSPLRALDANGTSPNFMLPLALSFVCLMQKKTVSLLAFSKGALGAAVGMTVYEILQIWMPWRTFDIWDIAASFGGAIAGILLASLLFFREETARHVPPTPKSQQ